MEHALLSLTDADRFRGMYVTVASMESREVIAGGKDPALVLEESARKGFTTPLLVFVPETDAVWIY